ncbi:MAG: YbaB/EbfC family nucleoid-associated protein [Phycicoccus sp.]
MDLVLPRGTPSGRRPVDEDRDLDDILDGLDAEQRALDAAAGLMSTVERAGTSADRLVEVRVRGLGSLAGVVIHPDAMRRHDHESLAVALLEAFGIASRAASAEVVGAFPSVFGDLAPHREASDDTPGGAPVSGNREGHQRAVKAWRDLPNGRRPA